MWTAHERKKEKGGGMDYFENRRTTKYKVNV